MRPAGRAVSVDSVVLVDRKMDVRVGRRAQAQVNCRLRLRPGSNQQYSRGNKKYWKRVERARNRARSCFFCIIGIGGACLNDPVANMRLKPPTRWVNLIN